MATAISRRGEHDRPSLLRYEAKLSLKTVQWTVFNRQILFGFPSIAIGHSLFCPKRHTVTFWRFTFPRIVQRGSGRVRSPSKCCRISHPFHRFGRKGISPSAEGDQRAPPSGLLRAGLSSTSLSRRLRRLKMSPVLETGDILVIASFLR